jgi:hypothetical protein
VWQDEYRAVLVYDAAETAPGGPSCIAEFGGCLVATFGYPNDEALGGHPLYAAGLSFYGVFEVEASPWIARLQSQNAVQFPDASWWPNSPYSTSGPVRHFIITFQDSTFECLARSFDGSFTDLGPLEALRSRIEESRW